MTELLALGISHKTAPVALRERLAFTEQSAAEFARRAHTAPGVREAVVISTCNRTEVYLTVTDPVSAESAVLAMLVERAGIRPTELAEVIYSPRNCDAARHLFRVASGLDSMIVGEAEIQGQVKRSYERARTAGLTGPLTNRLFEATLTTGKRVRSETAIGTSKVSVSSIAVDLAREVLGDLSSRHVVVIGAGDTAELTARALSAQGVRTVFLANRHADRARSVADRFGGHVVSLDKLPEQLEEADIVLSSTSSPHAIVGAEELALVMRARRHRPLLIIDIAVPRDIDPRCDELDGVMLYDIDDLQSLILHNVGQRTGELGHAERIVEDEIHRFARWLSQLEVRPTIAALHERGEAIVATVLEENRGRWESASSRDLQRIEALAQAVAARLLHEPTARLREPGAAARSHGNLQLLRELFGIEDPADGEAPAPAAAQDNVRQLAPRRKRAAGD